MTGAPAKPQMLTTLQALRAFAAVIVLVYHSNTEIFTNPKYFTSEPSHGLFQFGHAGVDIFFVLSGFIMFHLYRFDHGAADMKNYLERRLIRIYPPYWMVLTALLGAGAAAYGRFSSGDVLSSYLLAPFAVGPYGSPKTVLIVAWSLYHEVLFYLLFAIFIWSRAAGGAVLGLWLAGSLILLVAPGPAPALATFYFHPIHLLFGLGLFSAWIAEKVTRDIALACVVLGALLFLLTAAADDRASSLLPAQARFISYGLAAMGVIIGLVNLESRQAIHAPKAAVLLGDASYSIYLIHQPALVLAAKVIARIAPATRADAGFFEIAMPLFAIAAGVGLHLAVEKPLIHRLTARIRQPRAGLSPKASAAG